MLKGLFAGCAALALGGAVALGATCAPACASAERAGTTEVVACGARYVDADGDGVCDNRDVCDETCAGGALACDGTCSEDAPACDRHACRDASDGVSACAHHGGNGACRGGSGGHGAHHGAHRCW